jgi:predicted nucleotidyltransferase
MLKKKLPIIIKKHIQRLNPEVELILFGSRARGDINYSSDWDFLILTNEDISESIKDTYRSILFDIELEYDEVISSIIENKERWQNMKNQVTPLYKRIEEEGVLI